MNTNMTIAGKSSKKFSSKIYIDSFMVGFFQLCSHVYFRGDSISLWIDVFLRRSLAKLGDLPESQPHNWWGNPPPSTCCRRASSSLPRFQTEEHDFVGNFGEILWNYNLFLVFIMEIPIKPHGIVMENPIFSLSRPGPWKKKTFERLMFPY